MGILKIPKFALSTSRSRPFKQPQTNLNTENYVFIAQTKLNT